MSLTPTINPISALPVVSVEETKLHCNCDVATWDGLFMEWIKAATKALQVFTNLAFVPSNVTLVGRVKVYDDYDNYITLPYANNAVLNSGTNYTLVGDKIYTYDTDINITYTAGDEPEEWMKQAVKMYVADLYENRGESKQGQTGFSAGRADVGEQAKQFCKSFISHGYFF